MTVYGNSTPEQQDFDAIIGGHRCTFFVAYAIYTLQSKSKTYRGASCANAGTTPVTDCNTELPASVTIKACSKELNRAASTLLYSHDQTNEEADIQDKPNIRKSNKNDESFKCAS